MWKWFTKTHNKVKIHMYVYLSICITRRCNVFFKDSIFSKVNYAICSCSWNENHIYNGGWWCDDDERLNEEELGNKGNSPSRTSKFFPIIKNCFVICNSTLKGHRRIFTLKLWIDISVYFVFANFFLVFMNEQNKMVTFKSIFPTILQIQ